MGRSTKKGPFIDEHLVKKVNAEIQKGTKNPIQARVSRTISRAPFLDLTTLIPRLRRPCGVRMITIARLAASINIFAIDGFIAHSSFATFAPKALSRSTSWL